MNWYYPHCLGEYITPHTGRGLLMLSKCKPLGRLYWSLQGQALGQDCITLKPWADLLVGAWTVSLHKDRALTLHTGRQSRRTSVSRWQKVQREGATRTELPCASNAGSSFKTSLRFNWANREKTCNVYVAYKSVHGLSVKIGASPCISKDTCVRV